MVQRCLILWVAFLIFQLFLPGIGWLLVENLESNLGVDQWTAGLLIYLFGFIGLVILMGGFNAHRFVKASAVASTVSEGSEGVRSQPERVWTIFILRMAAFEMVGLLGFILLLLTGRFADMVPFSIASILTILLNRPTANYLRNIAR